MQSVNLLPRARESKFLLAVAPASIEDQAHSNYESDSKDGAQGNGRGKENLQALFTFIQFWV